MRTAVCALLIAGAAATARPFDLKDALGKIGSALEGVNVEDVASGILDGVFTKSDLTVADIAGVWKTTGSAVTFRSDSFLQRAGGSAAASVAESKIDPYLKQYGLLNSTITVTDDGAFTLQTTKATLKGTIKVNDKKNSSGNFTVNFKALGLLNLGTFDTYVEMVQNPLSSRRSVKIMFDADKIQKLMKGLAVISKSQMAKTASDLLNQYEGICVGFQCDYTGKAPAASSQPATGTNTQGNTKGSTASPSDSTGSGSLLQDIIRNSRKKK